MFGFDPFDKLWADELTTGGLSSPCWTGCFAAFAGNAANSSVINSPLRLIILFISFFKPQSNKIHPFCLSRDRVMRETPRAHRMS